MTQGFCQRTSSNTRRISSLVKFYFDKILLQIPTFKFRQSTVIVNRENRQDYKYITQKSFDPVERDVGKPDKIFH